MILIVRQFSKQPLSNNPVLVTDCGRLKLPRMVTVVGYFLGLEQDKWWG